MLVRAKPRHNHETAIAADVVDIAVSAEQRPGAAVRLSFGRLCRGIYQLQHDARHVPLAVRKPPRVVSKRAVGGRGATGVAITRRRSMAERPRIRLLDFRRAARSYWRLGFLRFLPASTNPVQHVQSGSWGCAYVPSGCQSRRLSCSCEKSYWVGIGFGRGSVSDDGSVSARDERRGLLGTVGFVIVPRLSIDNTLSDRSPLVRRDFTLT